MKRLISVVVVVMMLCVVGISCAKEKDTKKAVAKQSAQTEAAAWLTDFEAAKKMAADKNLPILADFSGSDWCGWCIKLDEEVFSQTEFKEYAEKNVILFLADFPSKKKQSSEVKSQNEKLSKEYQVQGFPTVLLLDKDGKVKARTGYKPGGAAAYVTHIKGLIKGK